MSLSIGYLLEIMLPALDYINLILYPVCAMLGALVFSDKSERKLEEERAQGKRGQQGKGKQAFHGTVLLLGFGFIIAEGRVVVKGGPVCYNGTKERF